LRFSIEFWYDLEPFCPNELGGFGDNFLIDSDDFCSFFIFQKKKILIFLHFFFLHSIGEDIKNLGGFFPVGTKLPVRRKGDETQPGEILAIKNADDGSLCECWSCSVFFGFGF